LQKNKKTLSFNFLSCQHDLMPYKYKKHQWLINPIDRVMLNVGVILYKSRDDLIDYVTKNGYLYNNIDEVIEIIKNNFDNTKRINVQNLCKRYIAYS
jgi:hypothetical protein